MNITFVNNTGDRDSGGFVTGYSWLAIGRQIQKDEYIKADMGLSFEQSDHGQILINQSVIHYESKFGIFSMGRKLSASSELFRDLSDFGAPGAGNDNIPRSFFFTGSYPANVAQQVSTPFANRLAYAVSYHDHFGLKLSYAPHIPADNPANYRYFSDGADVKDEISVATSAEWSWRNYLFGMTTGMTDGTFDDVRQFTNGDIHSHQVSFYTRHDKSSRNYTLYEAVYGCMDGDFKEKDCRASWQISQVTGRWIKSTSLKRRVFQNENYNDYSTGLMYVLGKGTRIGAEMILRTKRFQDQLNGDLHWNFGMSQRF
ncbi:MAG: hypothetical protein AAF621_01330 [Pseudomonadota bacterium]